jgi:aspartate/methionine/tyrosine aminotransferase
MKLREFAMERYQSIYENTVEFNLSESGVHPATLADIGVDPAELATIRLGYPQSNGTEQFRSLAASLYNDATERNITATMGGIEANFHAVLRLIEPGDDALLLLPNYMQVYGLVESFGGRVIPVWNRIENDWMPDPDEIARKITPKTRFISLSNPNNPSASVFGLDMIKAIAAIADKHGCWILSDEVYRGAERNGERTPSFWGIYPKTIVTQSLSKAYGTPGLRMGWLLGPEDIIAEMWGQSDYTKIAPAGMSDFVGCRVLENREKLFARTRQLMNQNWPNLKAWLDKRGNVFTYTEPKAAAICMVKYKHRINSMVLAERLRTEKSTLIVAGDHFGIDGYIRFGFGAELHYMYGGLTRVGEVLDTIATD